MPATFLSLPGEIRNKIYEHLLVYNDLIIPWKGVMGKVLVPNILATNSTILNEARSFLYHQNCFDLSDHSSFDLFDHRKTHPHFLDVIGPLNASLIRSIFMVSPYLSYLKDKNTLEVYVHKTLEKMASQCSALETLTAGAGRLIVDAAGYTVGREPSTEAIPLVNSYFNRIPSLKQIWMVVYHNGPSTAFQKEMECHGWVTEAVEPPANCDLPGWDELIPTSTEVGWRMAFFDPRRHLPIFHWRQPPRCIEYVRAMRTEP